MAFVSSEVEPERWLPPLAEALPEMRFEAWPEVPDPAAIDVALVAAPPAGLLGRFHNLRFIQSLWMGVDGLLADPALPRGVPIARLVDPGMVAAMSETVLARVLDWHRHLYRYRAQQAAQEWKPLKQYLAADRTVGILGLGALGADAAAKLVALGFRVLGWSRRRKAVPGAFCHTGTDGLETVLRQSDVLVCLLPLTAATRGLLDARRLALLPEGACIINVARGAHVVERDLLAALESGRVSHAYLDVFESEPLPADHPFWTHPKVSVTPHIAALTEPRTARAKVVANLERFARGEPPEGLVDAGAGY
ncbi:MAG: glyoxylate/hydroxypyruvate reductase A [Burkholderiales bacterium]|nr:glyoxylate/hydroxypyruvate reductase A [Burkholderiales bacterium]